MPLNAIQYHNATFIVFHARFSNIPLHIRENTPQKSQWRVAHLVHLMLAVYRSAVIASIKTTLLNELDASLSRATRPKDKQFLKKGQRSVELWAKSDFPFKLGDDLAHLLFALSQRGHPIHTPPPAGRNATMKIDDFALALLQSANNPSGRIRLGVVWPRDLFPQVVKAVFAEIPRVYQEGTRDLYPLVTKLVVAELGRWQAEVVPGPATNSTTSINPRSWTTLTFETLPRPVMPTASLTPRQAEKRKADEELREAGTFSAMGPWSVLENRMRALEYATKKGVEPDEWVVEGSGAAVDLSGTDPKDYEGKHWGPYFKQNWDIRNKWIHRFALIVGTACALMHPHISASEFNSDLKEDEFHRQFLRTPWRDIRSTSRSGKVDTGASHAAHYVFLIAAFVAAVYDESLYIGAAFAKADNSGSRARVAVWPPNFNNKWSSAFSRHSLHVLSAD